MREVDDSTKGFNPFSSRGPKMMEDVYIDGLPSSRDMLELCQFFNITDVKKTHIARIRMGVDTGSKLAKRLLAKRALKKDFLQTPTAISKYSELVARALVVSHTLAQSSRGLPKTDGFTVSLSREYGFSQPQVLDRLLLAMRVNGALLALEDPSLLREFQKYAGLYLDKQRKIDPSLRSVSTIPFLKLANHQIGISDWYRALYRSQSSGVDENSRLQPARRTIANFMVISELGYWENCLRYCKQNRVALPMGIKYLEMIALASSQRATAIEDTVFQIQNQTGIIIEKKVLYDQSLLIFADMPEFD